MKWSDFHAAVMALIGPESERAGNELALAGWIKSALSDLQDKVDALTVGHETIYRESDMVQDGCCSRGVFPSGLIQMNDVWVIRGGDVDAGEEADDASARWPVLTEEWGRRMEFIHGTDGFFDSARLIPDPQGITFYMWPALSEAERYFLSVHWNGKKLEFSDDEETPFDDDVAAAVAEWVLAHSRRSVEGDLQAYASHMQSYGLRRRDLYVSKNRRRAIA